MSQRLSAARYARALLDVAVAESDPAKIEQDLSSLVAAMTESAALRRALTAANIPAPIRRNVVQALAQQAAVEPPLAKLLTLLADRGRLELLPALLEVYRERLLAQGATVPAAVTSAAPLSTAQIQSLEAKLGEMTGKKVLITTAVDPTLIGGVVTRIGSTVYDGSLRTQLQNMKRELVEQA